MEEVDATYEENEANEMWHLGGRDTTVLNAGWRIKNSGENEDDGLLEGQILKPGC